MIKRFFFLFGLLLLTGGGWWARKVSRQIWNRKDQFNLALVQPQEVFLLALSPEQKTAFLVRFAADLWVEAAGGYGEFKLDKIDDLARQEKKSDLILRTVENNFGFPLDFLFFTDQRKFNFSSQRPFASLRGFLKRLAFGSSFPLAERINLLLVSWSLKDRLLVTQFLEGKEEGFLRKDGENWYLDQEKWDDWASVFLADAAFQEENLAVGVYNTGAQSGLAEKTARLLTNGGMIVVAVRDDSRSVANCLVALRQESYWESKTVKEIRRLLPDCQVEVVEATAFKDSTQINIYLGKEFGRN